MGYVGGLPMAVDLSVVIEGTVGPDIVTVHANGVQVPLNGRTYSVTVPATTALVAITCTDARAQQWTRTIQLDSVPVVSAPV